MSITVKIHENSITRTLSHTQSHTQTHSNTSLLSFCVWEVRLIFAASSLSSSRQASDNSAVKKRNDYKTIKAITQNWLLWGPLEKK